MKTHKPNSGREDAQVEFDTYPKPKGQLDKLLEFPHHGHTICLAGHFKPIYGDPVQLTPLPVIPWMFPSVNITVFFSPPTPEGATNVTDHKDKDLEVARYLL